MLKNFNLMPGFPVGALACLILHGLRKLNDQYQVKSTQLFFLSFCNCLCDGKIIIMLSLLLFSLSSAGDFVVQLWTCLI